MKYCSPQYLFAFNIQLIWKCLILSYLLSETSVIYLVNSPHNHLFTLEYISLTILDNLSYRMHNMRFHAIV